MITSFRGRDSYIAWLATKVVMGAFFPSFVVYDVLIPVFISTKNQGNPHKSCQLTRHFYRQIRFSMVHDVDRLANPLASATSASFCSGASKHRAPVLASSASAEWCRRCRNFRGLSVEAFLVDMRQPS